MFGNSQDRGQRRRSSSLAERAAEVSSAATAFSSEVSFMVPFAVCLQPCAVAVPQTAAPSSVVAMSCASGKAEPGFFCASGTP